MYSIGEVYSISCMSVVVPGGGCLLCDPRAELRLVILVLRGTIVNGTRGIDKNPPPVYIQAFLLLRGAIVNRTKYC